VIVVDSSVWVEALRDPRARLAVTLNGLLDADEVALAQPVRIELVAGVARADRAALKRALTALPVVVPTEQTWQRVEQWIEKAADAGQRFGLPDLLVAALADDLGALVWSLDADFVRMARLKLVRLYG
jgi:predicted nucleic acid-binding protein